MQKLRDKVLPKLLWAGKRIFAVLMLVALVVFGAADFAHLFLPDEWMQEKTRVLEWVQFAAYLAAVGIVIWKWQSIQAWGKRLLDLREQWPVSDMILAALAVMGIIGFAPLLLPKEWMAPDTSVLQRLQFAAYLVGGGFLIRQLQISNRRAKALEETAAHGKKGNITERFKNAIEHLADKMDSVQIGGIYTLYHVAKEAAEYKETVLKILLAHLRKITAGEEKPATNRVVMAIWDTLFVRRGEKPLFKAVDLSYVNLKGSSLVEMSSFGYNLGTIYSAVDLDLTGAYFKYAHLSGADMSFAICEGTTFDRAFCVETGFYAVRFNGASFIDADLRKADFRNSNITAEQLLEAKTLYKAELPDAVRKEIMRVSPRLLDKPDEDK